jgi:hypothetical protein
VTWPPKIGSPQWAYQKEQFGVVEQFLKDKLSDDRQYLADPMGRADDRAMLQNIENSLKIFKLDEELLTNPSPERTAQINAQRAAFSATQPDTFSFLQRIGQQRNARFEQAMRIWGRSHGTSHVTGTLGTVGVKPVNGAGAQHAKWNDALLRKLFPGRTQNEPSLARY